MNYCFYIVFSDQVWCGCGKEARIAIFNTETLLYTLLPINTKESKVALTKMALMGNEVKRRNRQSILKHCSELLSLCLILIVDDQ